MNIDAHQHFWRYAPETHAWIDDTMPVLRRDFLPGDLAPLLHGAGFDGCVAVQAAQTLAETRWLLDLAAEHPFIQGVVGWVDLRSAALEQTLDALCSNRRFKGVRHIVQSEADGFLDDGAFRRGVAALGKRGLTYDVLVYARQLPQAVRFVRDLPDVTFVLDHLGKPDIRRAERSEWQAHVRALAAHPNVFCKLSGLVTEADWKGWRREDFAPHIDAAVECFGAGRLLVGSDWPVCTLAASYDEVIGITRAYFGQFSATEQRAVFGANAARVYGIQ
jgi:L-fuconolactonase